MCEDLIGLIGRARNGYQTSAPGIDPSFELKRRILGQKNSSRYPLRQLKKEVPPSSSAS